MATKMSSCEFDRYDKKQRPCNLYTLVGVLMALLESIFSAANSSAGLVEAAIFVLDEPTRSARAAGRLAPLAARLRAPRSASARSSYRTAFSHPLLSRLSEFVGVSCGLLVWSARVPRRSIRLMRFALSDNP